MGQLLVPPPTSTAAVRGIDRSWLSKNVVAIASVLVVLLTIVGSWPTPGGFVLAPFALADTWFQRLPPLPADIQAFRVAVRPLLVPVLVLLLGSVYLTSRLQRTPGRLTIRSIQSKAGRALLVVQVAALAIVFCSLFLAGYGFQPPDRRVYMNDFRWDLIWLGTCAIELLLLFLVSPAISQLVRLRRGGRSTKK